MLLIVELAYRFWVLRPLTRAKMNEIFILMTVTSVDSSQCPESLRPLAASWDSPHVFMVLGGSRLYSLLFLPLTLEPFRSPYF